MTKAEARVWAKEQAKLWSAEEVALASLAMANDIMANYVLLYHHVVHLYLTRADSHELDTSYLLSALWKRRIATCTSVTSFETMQLQTVALPPDAALQPNKWGIREPEVSQPFDEGQITHVFVPLLACDAQGNRVGYGKGFYDKFLARLQPETLFVGLSLFPPLAESIGDIEAWDIPLHALIEPTGVHLFDHQRQLFLNPYDPES